MVCVCDVFVVCGVPRVMCVCVCCWMMLCDVDSAYNYVVLLL